MGSTATIFIVPLLLTVIFLIRSASSVDCTCEKVRFEICQKDALFYNREFISRYTAENVESFSVELFQEPILVATREQTKLIKKKYRSMFIYPEKEEEIVVTEEPLVAEIITQPPTVPESRDGGILVERNNTCTNTTQLEYFSDWTRITENIECNITEGPGQVRRTTHRSTKYVRNERRRVRRQANKLRLCKADYIPSDRVLYTVTKSGETVQVAQVEGAYQDQGDISCTAAPNKPPNIICELEMVDTPKVVFRLGKKTIDSQNIRVPRCTAFIRV